MRIISINVNNFGGTINKPLLKDYNFDGKTDWTLWRADVDRWRKDNSKNIEENVKQIVSVIMDFEVIFLHEVDTNCDSWRKLHEYMNQDYDWKPANDINKAEYNKGKKSVSIVFVRKGICYEYDSIPNFLKDSQGISQRNIEIEIDGVTIIGLHMSYNLDDWDKLISRFENRLKEGKNVLLIGDMNVFDLGTARREKLEQLYDMGARDLWLEQGEANDTPTADTQKRIDYALASSGMIEKGIKTFIINSIRRNHHTDHAGIAVIY